MSQFNKYMEIVNEARYGSKEIRDIIKEYPREKKLPSKMKYDELTDKNKDSIAEKLQKTFKMSGGAQQYEYVHEGKSFRFAIARKDISWYIMAPHFDSERSKVYKSAFQNAAGAIDKAIAIIKKDNKLVFNGRGPALGEGDYATIDFEKPKENKK